MNIPIVPYHAFSSLAGEALAEELDQLVHRRNFSELVLFSDPHGTKVALLPVGTGHRHVKLADAAVAELNGLRPLCAVRVGDAGANPRLEHERDLVRLESTLKAREHYLAECEQRIADVGQKLSVREALLEQREHTLINLEQDFFDRSGVAPPGFTPPPPPGPPEKG